LIVDLLDKFLDHDKFFGTQNFYMFRKKIFGSIWSFLDHRKK
jgi:hypothetical protein